MHEIFEGVIFAELHWKIDVIRSIERLVLKYPPDYRDREQEGALEPHVRNFFYLKCSSTIDEFLLSLLYVQDRHLMA